MFQYRFTDESHVVKIGQGVAKLRARM